MRNVIQLLPDALANQIAAGEVVQRPASVVKELMENAVDAGATRIDVYLSDAGRTLIQITDNGSGMSAQDARMAFERHATSKIRQTDDLFRIRTLGFRGEALASIAAVAQVRLRTRLAEEELGIELDIEGSEAKRQTPAAMPPGSTFQVRNLFYNVPARRNFLKSNPVEMRHILSEFIRIALPHPELHFSLSHNDNLIYNLQPSSLKDRLVAAFGQDLSGALLEVEEATGYVQISGLMGSPLIYRRQRGEQFFFVNRRFIKSPSLSHAITTAYQEYIPKETFPFYCIFLEIDPEHVDVNIHPTKTEVKFDDENTIYALLQGAARKSLAELHHVSKENQGSTDLERKIYSSAGAASSGEPITIGKFRPKGDEDLKTQWDILFKVPQPAPESGHKPPRPDLLAAQGGKRAFAPEENFFLQYQGTYILTTREDRLVIIDQHLAHQRVLFEKMLQTQRSSAWSSQQLLFPQTLQYSPGDYLALREVDEVLAQMGFEAKEFGPNTLIIYGAPSGVATSKIQEVFDQILADVKNAGAGATRNRIFEGIARAVALRSAIPGGQRLSVAEMRNLAEDLFRCTAPGYSPNGKPTFKEISPLELEEYFR
jgi:DNA mismatch repair protein MutL